jgi:hypothetical protein
MIEAEMYLFLLHASGLDLSQERINVVSVETKVEKCEITSLKLHGIYILNVEIQMLLHNF